MPLLLLLCLAWITGIFLGSIYPFPVWILSFSILPVFLIPFLKQHLRILLVSIPVLILLLGGCIYYQYSEPSIDESSLRYYNGSGTVTVEGMISNDPAVRDRTTSFHLSANSIITTTGKKQVTGTAMVKTNSYQQYRYGDILKVTGKLQTPENTTGFDYKNYLTAKNIYSQINYPYLETIDTGRGIKPLEWIYDLRAMLSESIERAMPMPQSSLAQAMFLGITDNIPQELRDLFSRTGTNHILAISGMNLTIIMGMLLSLGIWAFGRRYSIYVWLSLGVIWFYSILTGIQPPIVRSAVMGSMFLLAELLGRQKHAITGITFAAAVMIGLNPPLLRDVSFQLSFLSMCGLVFVYPEFNKYFIQSKPDYTDRSYLKKAAYYIFDNFIVIISVILVTWPMIAYHFGLFTLFALPATVFILPVFPAIILVTFLASVTGIFFLPLAQVIGWLDWILLGYFIVIVNIFSTLPLASLDIIHVDLIFIAVYYPVLILIFFIFRNFTSVSNRVKKGAASILPVLGNVINNLLKLPLKWIAVALLAVTILVWAALITMPDGRLHVSILDVGQGDSILVQTPQRQNILIDGGPGSSALDLALGKKLPFWDRKIDLLIITQPDADHIGGLTGIINNYEIKRVVCATIVSDSETFQQLMNGIKEKNIPYTQVNSWQVIEAGQGINFEILHPSFAALPCKAADPDCNDLVVRLSWNRISFLFTADIGTDTELALINNRSNLNSTVLKIGHHGSNTSTGSRFLSVVNPSTAVISAGMNNSYGHPDKEVISRILSNIDRDKLFLTSEHGTVEFITDGEKLWVSTEKH